MPEQGGKPLARQKTPTKAKGKETKKEAYQGVAKKEPQRFTRRKPRGLKAYTSMTLDAPNQTLCTETTKNICGIPAGREYKNGAGRKGCP